MSRILIQGLVAAVLSGAAAALLPLPARAAGYDIDCAVILCLAAGFPADPSGTCSKAYSYMIDRITDLPPEPPFDLCKTSDGSSYDSAEVTLSRPSHQSREGWLCPEPAPMRLDRTGYHPSFRPVCYPDAAHTPSLWAGRSGSWFLGAPVAADRVAYRFRVTIPTGGGASYVSPVFLVDPARGFSRALTDEEQAEYGAQRVLPVDDAP